MAGALAQHAEATMDRIGAERQGVVREVFRNLMTAQGTRAVVEREELLSAFPETAGGRGGPAGADRRAARDELRGGGREGEPSRHRIEVVHESLLKAWPRLVRWQAQDEEGAVLRDQLKQAAHLWEEKGRTSDLLWTGTAFQEYVLWRDRYAGALTALEEDFAKAMAERARRAAAVPASRGGLDCCRRRRRRRDGPSGGAARRRTSGRRPRPCAPRPGSSSRWPDLDRSPTPPPPSPTRGKPRALRHARSAALRPRGPLARARGPCAARGGALRRRSCRRRLATSPPSRSAPTAAGWRGRARQRHRAARPREGARRGSATPAAGRRSRSGSVRAATSSSRRVPAMACGTGRFPTCASSVPCRLGGRPLREARSGATSSWCSRDRPPGTEAGGPGMGARLTERPELSGRFRAGESPWVVDIDGHAHVARLRDRSDRRLRALDASAGA